MKAPAPHYPTQRILAKRIKMQCEVRDRIVGFCFEDEIELSRGVVVRSLPSYEINLN